MCKFQKYKQCCSVRNAFAAIDTTTASTALRALERSKIITLSAKLRAQAGMAQACDSVAGMHSVPPCSAGASPDRVRVRVPVSPQAPAHSLHAVKSLPSTQSTGPGTARCKVRKLFDDTRCSDVARTPIQLNA